MAALGMERNMVIRLGCKKGHPHYNKIKVSYLLTCSRHRGLQKIEFQLSKSFVMIFFARSKVRTFAPESRNLS